MLAPLARERVSDAQALTERISALRDARWFQPRRSPPRQRSRSTKRSSR
jgi:hypothetical protein